MAHRLIETKEQYLTRLKFVNAHKEDLPHLFGKKFYPWQREYLNSTNKTNHLVAANQIGKSIINWTKAIHWATEVSLWPKLWPTDPRQFWYLYPSLGLATREWDEKIKPELMPKGVFKDHPIYGWEEVKKRGELYAIKFRHCTIYARSYFQKAEDQQAASVHAIFTDEELPEHLYSELNARRSGISIKGYYHMAYTATLGQEMWRQTMEPASFEKELFPDAHKQRISLYDCLEYEDGSPSLWTLEDIEERKKDCKNRNEILRRIYGRFVKDEDLKYTQFDRKKHCVKPHKMPRDWLIYTGTDIGSGGTSHPTGIIFVAVNREFTKGRVFLAWRGDGIETTSTMILEKYLQMRGKMKPVGEYYDWQAKDFLLTARSAGLAFQAADKSQDMGANLLNDLFKKGMLKIHLGSDDEEMMKLVIELENLKESTKKSNARDDLIDALRFAVTRIPWDFSAVNDPYHEVKVDPYKNLTAREKLRKGIDEDNQDDVMDMVELELAMSGEVYDYGVDYGEGFDD